MKRIVSVLLLLVAVTSCKKELAKEHLGDYEGTYHNTGNNNQYPTVTIQFKEYSGDKNKMDVYVKNNGLFLFTLKMVDSDYFVIEEQNCTRWWLNGKIVSGNGKFSGSWVSFGLTHKNGSGSGHLYEEFGGRKQ